MYIENRSPTGVSERYFKRIHILRCLQRPIALHVSELPPTSQIKTALTNQHHITTKQ